MKECVKYHLYLKNECQDSANVDQVKLRILNTNKLRLGQLLDEP